MKVFLRAIIHTTVRSFVSKHSKPSVIQTELANRSMKALLRFSDAPDVYNTSPIQPLLQFSISSYCMPPPFLRQFLTLDPTLTLPILFHLIHLHLFLFIHLFIHLVSLSVDR